MADGPRSVWRVNDAFKRRLPLKLTLAELVALLMSRDLLTANGAGVLGPAITAAVEKIGCVLSKDTLGLIDRMRDTIGVRAIEAKLQAPAAEHFAAIQGALIDRQPRRDDRPPRRPFARYVRGHLWHPTGKSRDLDGERLEMTLRVTDTLEVRRWILGFGSEAEVLDPAALREALRRDAEAMARKLAPQRVPPAPMPLPEGGALLRRAVKPRASG